MGNPFVLPASLGLDLSGDRFNLRHDGDADLGQSLGKPIGVIDVQGDLTLRMSVVATTLRAGGVLRIHGDVEADTIYASEVHIEGTSVTARAISAGDRIVIGPARLKADVILAPIVELDPTCSGRVTVIESTNDRAPTKVRGGYSLAEYQEDFGDAESFLAERGVAALGGAPLPPPARATGPSATPAPAAHRDGLAPAPPTPLPLARNYKGAPPVIEESATITWSDPIPPEREVAPPRTPAPAPRANAPAPTPAPAPKAVPAPVTPIESDSDPISVHVADLEPVVDDPVHTKLTDALNRIVSCYKDGLPPPVETLQTLIAARDYPALRTSITDVWTGLLGYHQKKGVRPHHQVTHAFNVIHGLVSEL
jgi:hypothetical protein